MSCPTESHKIDEFDKKPKYDVSEVTYAPKGVKILKAVKIYQGKDSKEKMDLEKMLGQAADNTPVDSAWGEECGCNTTCGCDDNIPCKCDKYTCRYCPCVSECSCEDDNDPCRCQNYC
jgi:hypothetical protein